ncbi:MAG: glucosamine--fructose-6-phosphate aminotransferase [Chloroflexi bacterium]|nr:MAG: glucosamine--fructose-6-phosphate aminotransferase [Anaerolineaceae bacterium 4572_32.2]RLC90559.1 MAG: glucosamine--fructose-6-phosphate aminotransferase [Chloroflexota bacterium]
MGLKKEIFEQPDTLQRLLDTQMARVEHIAAAIRQRDVDYVFLAARGTSDHAGLYAKYLWGAYNQLPMALAAPSLFSIYSRPPALRRALVMGISQSGQSPDIVGVLAEGKRQSAPTLAITNDTNSPLAQAAEFIVDISAGDEQAVAATKTYTAQLLAIAMLSVAWSEDGSRKALLRRVPEWVAQVLALDATIEQVAERYRYMDQCVVLGRGYNYATAFEWSLKLKELAYVVAEPYSSADFQHGPIAIVDRGFPILAVAPGGAVYADMLALLSRLADKNQAELLVISDQGEALALGRTSLRLPGNVPEWLSPLVSIVPAQLFCYHLTRAKGYNTEAPRGLSKVTLTP